MKKVILIALTLAFFWSCKQGKKIGEYESYGSEITADNALSSNEMLTKFNEMVIGDTLSIKFKGNVNVVCQGEGCWMKIGLQDTIKESMVKFKDSKFFVPIDSKNAEAIVQGKAYKSEIPITDLKHYAKDAGKSEEEIAKITEPKLTYNFEAEGVLLKR